MARVRFFRSSMVAKQILLNLFVILAMGGVVIANLVLSYRIGDTLNTVIHKDIARVIENAELSRSLNTVFAETHLLLNTFTEREDILQVEGSRLLAVVQENIAACETDAIYDALVRFEQALEALLAQCAVIIQVFDQVQTLADELDAEISELEELVTELIIARKIEGKDYELSALDQVNESIPDDRSLLLQITMQLANDRREYLSLTPINEIQEQQFSNLFADLSSNLITATTAGDELAQPGKQLIATVQRYQESITIFHQAMQMFQTQLREVDMAQAQVMAVMETIDNEVAQATGRIQGQAAYQIRTSRNVILFFSVIVIGILGGVAIYAVKITRPIQHLTESAATIAAGNLDTPIDSSGADEIGQLARSFAHMRDVIRTEMEALAEKNADLLVEITERKRAEEALRVLNDELEFRVNQRTAGLEAANKELKEFAYVVSHDLKAPLRGLCRLAQWLVEDYSDKLDQHGQEQLALLVEQAKRMEHLINGVLHYSKAVHGSEHEESIDLNMFVPQVVKMLMPPIRVTIQITNELPIIYGDPVRITQVFQNLLSNAVKFMDKPDGKIFIGCADTGAMWTFLVEDNGQGIESQHYERIFQIFQTMTPAENGESTGIGLTVVKKIVELYGGRIWVESTLGEGSRFYFTWPK